MDWIPTPFNLFNGNPFEYSEHAISSTSGTEAFESAIKKRDEDFCVVCGDFGPWVLNYCHIIPKGEDETWEEMIDRGFLPAAAKSVDHEPRNGILLCPNHRILFDKHYFYIRWMPEQRRFVFINHSQLEYLEPHHGRAINLHAGDDRLPFHGAFLFHEMRVRGYWPLYEDRTIPLPIKWVNWLDDGEDDDGDEGQGPGNNERRPRPRLRSIGPVPKSGTSGKVFVPTNPFQNPAELQALKESFAEQPNWRASIMEGTTWEGSADENAAKWRKLNRIDA